MKNIVGQTDIIVRQNAITNKHRDEPILNGSMELNKRTSILVVKKYNEEKINHI